MSRQSVEAASARSTLSTASTLPDTFVHESQIFTSLRGYGGSVFLAKVGQSNPQRGKGARL
jgi:hypothetical protein